MVNSPLSQDLEQLVKLTIATKKLYQGEDSPITDNIRREGSRIYTALRDSRIYENNPELFTTGSDYTIRNLLKEGSTRVKNKLVERLDEKTYNTAKDFYLGKLNENSRTGFYLQMLNLGYLPREVKKDNPKTVEMHAALGNLTKYIKGLSAATQALASGDSQTFANIVQEVFSVEPMVLAGLLSPGGRPMPGDESKVFADVLEVNDKAIKETMTNLLKVDKHLYNVIDLGINSNPQAKVDSLISIYNLYNSQRG